MACACRADRLRSASATRTPVNLDGPTPPEDLTVQLGSLLVGYSYKLHAKSFLNLALGIGATRDAPDVQINLPLPTTF